MNEGLLAKIREDAQTALGLPVIKILIAIV